MIPYRFYRLTASLIGFMTLLIGGIMGVSQSNQEYNCLEISYIDGGTSQWIIDAKNRFLYQKNIYPDIKDYPLASFSPDKKHSVYFSQTKDGLHLYAKSERGSDQLLIPDAIWFDNRTFGDLLYNIKWSPDSSKVAYEWASTSNSEGMGLANSDGTHSEEIASGANLLDWSADSKYLAIYKYETDTIGFWSASIGKMVRFTLQSGGNWDSLNTTWSHQGNKFALIRYNRQTTDLLIVAPEHGIEFDEPFADFRLLNVVGLNISWSTDDNYIAISYSLSNTPVWPQHLVVVDLAKQTKVDLTDHLVPFDTPVDAAFDWHGNSLMFLEQETSGLDDLREFDPKQTSSVTLVHDVVDSRPMPGNKILAYVLQHDKRQPTFTLAEMNLETKEQYEYPYLLPGNARNFYSVYPSWDRHIALAAEGGGGQVQLMSSNGMSTTVHVSNTDESVMNAIFSPDGSEIAILDMFNGVGYPGYSLKFMNVDGITSEIPHLREFRYDDSVVWTQCTP